MSKTSDGAVSFGIGLIFGVLAGVAAGVLYSPKPGKEMREDLKNTMTTIAKDINPEIKHAQNVNEVVENFRYAMEKQLGKIQEAIKAGKMAAAKKREELETEYNY